MKLSLNAIGVLAMVVLAQACSVLPKNEPMPIDHYTLQVPPPTVQGVPAAHAPVLLIARPQTRADLDTPRIAYRQQDYDIRYFARSRWADTPADLLMPGLLEAFDASGHYGAVLRNGLPVSADLRLDSELLDFTQDFRVEPSQFLLRLRVQLVDLRKRRVLASRIFEARQTAPTDSPYGGVQAANQAWQQLLPEIVTFSVAHSVAP